MNTLKLDLMVEEISRSILLDLVHIIEDIKGKKTVRLASDDEIVLLDYLFADELYPIEEDRDYAELGDIFTETE